MTFKSKSSMEREKSMTSLLGIPESSHKAISNLHEKKPNSKGLANK